MKQDNNVFSKAKLLFAGVLSVSAVVGLCLLQYVDVPFDINAWWFKILALLLVVGCYFLVGWSMGVFHQDSALPFTHKRSAKHIHIRIPKMDIKEVADVVAQNLLQAGYHPVMDPTAGDADKHTFLWFQQCSGNKQEYVCVAAMQRIHIADLNHLMKASEVLLNNTDERMSYFQCLLLFISPASEKGADSIVNRCCSYYATSGEYTMLISGHLNAKTGLLSVSPPSVVGLMQWKKATRLLTNFIRPHEYL